MLRYLNAEISVGRFAELMGMHIIDARDWLHERGISTARAFRDKKLEGEGDQNARNLAKRLGISLPEYAHEK